MAENLIQKKECLSTLDMMDVLSIIQFLTISQIFVCANNLRQQMNETTRTNHRWKQLGYDNQKLPQRSAYSRDSSMHSKYTPTKKQISSSSQTPTPRLQLAALQSRITTVKHFSQKQQKQQQNKSNISDVISPTTFSNLVNRMNSIETQNPTPSNLNKRATARSNLSNIHPQKQDQILNQYYEKQQIKPHNVRNSHKPQRNSQQNNLAKPYELTKIGLLAKKASFQSEYDQAFPPQRSENNGNISNTNNNNNNTNNTNNNTNNIDDNNNTNNNTNNIDDNKNRVEYLLQKYINQITNIQKDLTNQRIIIQNQLQEKQRNLLKVRQQILKLFAKQQKNIQDPTLRSIIQDYIPKPQQKNNSLLRVTSQKIFNRIPGLSNPMRSSITTPNANNNNTNIDSQTQRTLKLADIRSVKSREGSAVKQNFNTIFQALNQMKKGLDDTDPTSTKQINTTKQLIVPMSPISPYKNQKTLKKSLLQIKNQKPEIGQQKQSMEKLNKQILTTITGLLKSPTIKRD